MIDFRIWELGPDSGGGALWFLGNQIFCHQLKFDDIIVAALMNHTLRLLDKKCSVENVSEQIGKSARGWVLRKKYQRCD